ncbi:hypothetical protein G6038_09510 [Rhodococcus sp. 14C212]|uniref:MmyB family transcriptional regulator n=1 Tax=Rhodococcus sp. 14C212 TaxID=2711209 RepID=UPI0013E9E489|nr:hypothetical protein [Rhodococcus sp. 14C212]NGP05715.1 hypothetical protein [Rhodococcus sp. 14C212]
MLPRRGSRPARPDWSVAANTAVALLHTEVRHDACDEKLTELVGELSTISLELQKLWAKHDVRPHLRCGYEDFRHPRVGGLHLSMDGRGAFDREGLTLTACQVLSFVEAERVFSSQAAEAAGR